MQALSIVPAQQPSKKPLVCFPYAGTHRAMLGWDALFEKVESGEYLQQFFTVKDESMICKARASIFPGWIVSVLWHKDSYVSDPPEDAIPGRVVVAMMDGKIIVRKLVKKGKRLLLEAYNPAYPVIPVTRKVLILGAVWLVSK